MDSNFGMDTNMKWVGGVAVVVILGAFVWWVNVRNDAAPRVESKNQTEITIPVSPAVAAKEIDIKNADYMLESRTVTIRDGVATETIPGSASTIKTSLLEGSAFADIDGDGKKDAVVILRDEPAGTGIFYYVSVILANSNPLLSTNAVLLGDRIRIKEIVITGNRILVTVLGRKEGEAMVVQPSVERTLMFQVVEGSLVKAQ